MEIDEQIEHQFHPRNSPYWARGCPKSYRIFQEQIARGGIELAGIPLSAENRGRIIAILGQVAAVSWAAGQQSVRESGGAVFELEDCTK